MQISREDLIEAIETEITRIFGKGGFNGDPKEYLWLQTNYNISEIDDVRWQFIVSGDVFWELSDELAEDIELMEFLSNAIAVDSFLIELLSKYRSNTASYR